MLDHEIGLAGWARSHNCLDFANEKGTKILLRACVSLEGTGSYAFFPSFFNTSIALLS